MIHGTWNMEHGPWIMDHLPTLLPQPKHHHGVTCSYRHILLPVLRLKGYRHRIRHPLELGAPKLLSCFGVESAEPVVGCSAEENQASCGNHWTGPTRATDILLSFRQRVVQRRLPGDVSRIGVHRDEAAP